MITTWSELKRAVLSPTKRWFKKTWYRASLPSQPTGESAAAPHSFSGDPEISPSLVVNDQDVLRDPAGVRLAIESIFETKQFDTELDSLFQFVLRNPTLWFSFGEIASGLRREIQRRMKSGEGGSVDRGPLLVQTIDRHLSKTEASRSAYLPNGKQNPNAVFWPDPTLTKGPRSLYSELPWANRLGLISRSTPIGSAGSCFAFEIAHHLQRNGFNYVITEPHTNAENGLSNSCARWGIIFNTPSFRQLVERAFGERVLPSLLWTQTRGEKIVFLDPFREDIEFDSVAHYEEDKKRHLPLVREALLECEYFVITLGVNEVWSLKADGSVFARSPWRIASDLVESKVMTVDENLAELQKMLDLMRKYNPRIQLIVSVSPVPLHATFRAYDSHVVVANAHSKATLRVVAEEFVRRNEGVYYFPSYEVVTYCTENPWAEDQRHVSRHAVENVMSLFEMMFLTSAK